MTNKTRGSSISNIINHMEFLGYSVSIPKSENPNVQLYIAEHTSKFNIVFFELNKTFTLFRINATTKRTYSPAMDISVNKANKSLTLSRIYFEIEESKAVLRFEATYLGEYQKTTFGSFLDLFVTEQANAINSDGFASAFLGDDNPVPK